MCLELYPALKLSAWLMLSSLAVFFLSACACVCVNRERREREESARRGQVLAGEDEGAERPFYGFQNSFIVFFRAPLPPLKPATLSSAFTLNPLSLLKRWRHTAAHLFAYSNPHYLPAHRLPSPLLCLSPSPFLSLPPSLPSPLTAFLMSPMSALILPHSGRVMRFDHAKWLLVMLTLSDFVSLNPPPSSFL